MTYLPQLGRSQSGTGRVLTQCPSESFSVFNFYDYVVTGSVKRTMKNTITRKPCSFPHPFVLLRIGRMTHGAIEDPLYAPALPKTLLPADGTQPWESLTAG